MKKKKIISIGGCTASGKTEAGLKLAKEIKGAIISCDSRQIYQELDIATDKIPYSLPYRDPVCYREIDHYGINIANVANSFTLHDWVYYAKTTIEKIYNNKQTPMLVGGTGLYIQAVINNYQLREDYDQKTRDELNKLSLNELQEKLKSLDPKIYDQIDNQNPRRVVRAIEKILGKVASIKYQVSSGVRDSGRKLLVTSDELLGNTGEGERYQVTSGKYQVGANAEKENTGSDGFESLVLAFEIDRVKLREKISRRVDEHVNKGVLDEVEELVKKYGAENQILNATIGIQEYIPVVLGQVGLEQAKERVIIDTYKYAKRQITWFKKYGNTVWCDSFETMRELALKFLDDNE